MYLVGRIHAALFLLSLFVTNSALPTTSRASEQTRDLAINATLGLDNETLVRLSNVIPWSPKFSSVQASVAYPVPDTAITLNFTHFGPQIPVVRALFTIYDARRQVISHLAFSSEAAINKNVFEYSTRSNLPAPRVCTVVVQASRDVGLSWLQLDQVLEGLTQFSSGAGIDRQVHYQALEFEINLVDTGRIGIGLLWCTPTRGRGVAEVERRAEVPDALDKRLNLMPGLANETSSSPSNTSGQPSTPTTEVTFPVPGTNISLAFIWRGNPIPSKTVNDALHGAFLKIAPLVQEAGSERSPHDRFLYRAAAGKVGVSIQIFGTPRLDWSQVDCVLAGLYRFANGLGTRREEEHFENLGFDVRDESGANIGHGNLLATPAVVYGGDSVSLVAEKKRSSLLLLLPSTNSTPPLPLPIPYPIPSTPLTLLITHAGAPLPRRPIIAALRAAYRLAEPRIRTSPDSAIPDSGFSGQADGVRVSVAPYEGGEVTWWELGRVLEGLAGFCVGAWGRALVFEVEAEGRGRVGAGWLWGVEGGGGVGGGGGIAGVKRARRDGIGSAALL